MMSSDSAGNMSSANDGDVRKFKTWNSAFTNLYGGPSYKFGAAADPTGAGTGVDISYHRMGSPNLAASVGSKTMLGLDNSVYDLDPTPFNIKINKNEFAFIGGTSATIGAGSAIRKLYNDGDADVAAPFFDRLFSSVGVRFSQGGLSMGSTFNFGQYLATWAPNEDDTAVKNYGAHDVSLFYDFSVLENGIYDVELSSTAWQHLGSDTELDPATSSFYPGISNSSFEGSMNDNDRYKLEVVPEPASMIALGIGAVALLRRRNKK